MKIVLAKSAIKRPRAFIALIYYKPLCINLFFTGFIFSIPDYCAIYLHCLQLLELWIGPILGCRPPECKDLMCRPFRDFFIFWLILNVDVIINSSTGIRVKSKTLIKRQIKFEVQNFIFWPANSDKILKQNNKQTKILPLK